MIILPAIDLKDGKCVRLYKGDFATVHKVAEDAVETARTFAAAGAAIIHMVDLDGALDGVRKNADIVRAVAQNSGVLVELGGGMRTMTDLDAADAVGVYRMVIGSAAVTDPGFVREAVKKYSRRIAVGIDAKDGRVRTSGWTADSGVDYIGFARSMESLGVGVIIFTDIETDGMQSGPSMGRLAALKAAVDCEIIASGGVSSVEDIKNLKALGIDGAIIGKAYYTGAIDIAAAIREAGEQCLQKG